MTGSIRPPHGSFDVDAVLPRFVPFGAVGTTYAVMAFDGGQGTRAANAATLVIVALLRRFPPRPGAVHTDRRRRKL